MNLRHLMASFLMHSKPVAVNVMLHFLVANDVRLTVAKDLA